MVLPSAEMKCFCFRPVLVAVAIAARERDGKKKSSVFTNVFTKPLLLRSKPNGAGEIRTHGTLAGTLVFKTSAFNRSATAPEAEEWYPIFWR